MATPAIASDAFTAGFSSYAEGDTTMKKLFSALLIICLFLDLTAYADHSVLRMPGEINETEALDRAVSCLCSELKLSEDEIRGKWYCSSEYYRKTENNIWWISLIDPNVNGFHNPLQIHREFYYQLNAADGSMIQTDESVAYDDPNDPLDWEFMLVPTKDQMQPAEALEKAQALLQEALNCDKETLHEWRDYLLTGITDMNSVSEKNGRFWYHIRLGYGGSLGDDTDALTWHVYLDANTREVIWQSDPERFAGRWAVQSTGTNWYDWFNEQKKIYTEKWGDFNTWDYLKYAEFDQHCSGFPYFPEAFYGLPGDTDLSYEEALTIAESWLTEHETQSDWHLMSSSFFIDLNNWYHTQLMQGIIHQERVWCFVFRRAGASDHDWHAQIHVYVDPETGEVVDGPQG